YAGISLGGMVGMHYASRQPAELDRLVLCNTSPRFPDRNLWLTRIQTVREQGMAGLVQATTSRFFTPAFVDPGSPACQRIRNTFLGIDPTGYAGCCAAIRDMDLFPGLGRIQAPTLVVTGEFDQSTP